MNSRFPHMVIGSLCSGGLLVYDSMHEWSSIAVFFSVLYWRTSNIWNPYRQSDQQCKTYSCPPSCFCGLNLCFKDQWGRLSILSQSLQFVACTLQNTDFHWISTWHPVVVLILKNYSNEEVLPDMWIFRPTMKLLYVISHQVQQSNYHWSKEKRKIYMWNMSKRCVWVCKCHCSSARLTIPIQFS